MGSTVNHSSDHQDQADDTINRVLHSGDGLLPQYFDGYRVVERLGGGAMATVYRAVDTQSHQEVALKVLAPGADDILRERFRVEARTVSTLEHPHIVRTLRVGQVQSGFPYIAMELVEGDSLATLLERQNQLSVIDSCLLLEPIARALAYAHSHHVVHRDVKPSNILLRHVTAKVTANAAANTAVSIPNTIQLSTLATPMIPLLSDFGIARALDAPELTSAGRTIGTPAYMSPEQCAGTRTLDGRADIYSLATVLYRCLVGRPPFMGATTQILHAHVYEALTIPETIAQALPSAILTILQRALQKNPDDRYADMALFADDLTAIVNLVRVPRNGVTEATLTMPLLTAMQPDQEKRTAHVLVSGVAEQNTRSSAARGRPETAGTGTGEVVSRNPFTTPRTTQSGAAITKPKTTTNSAARRRRSPNPMYLVIGGLLSVALIVLAVSAIWGILPTLDGGIPNGSGTQPAALVQTLTPLVTVDSSGTATTTVATALDGQSSTPALADRAEAVAAPATVPISVTATVTVPVAITGPEADRTLALSPTLGVTAPLTTEIAYDVGNIWKEDVLFFYGDREWRETRRRALEVFGPALQQEANVTLREVIQLPPGKQAELIAEKLLANTDAAFWTKWQGIVTPAEVEQVLFDSYVGIANLENKANRPEEALAYFDAALLIRTDAELITNLRLATARYAYAIGAPKGLAAQALSELYQNAATQFATNKAFCPALEYLDVAMTMDETAPLAATLQSYQEQCKSLPLVITPEETPPQQSSGALLYSTEENGVYRIYRVALGAEPASPTLVVENGSQPGVAPDGRYMAFYGTRSDALGLRLFDVSAARTPQSVFPQLSANIEDSRLSPPSWAPDSNRLAFSSNREGDRVMRVYVTAAPNPGTTTTVDFGEDPAWSPKGSDQSLLVYKGTDVTGNNPGLWLASETGVKVRQLTPNGSDRRPVWSPDGQYIVFMRQLDTGNWDLFRVRVADGSELRLTTHPAQDGLPTISPDGNWVAFASDRSGGWEIWQVALDGSGEQPLMPIQGVLRNWLEHAIQWVN